MTPNTQWPPRPHEMCNCPLCDAWVELNSRGQLGQLAAYIRLVAPSDPSRHQEEDAR